MQADSKLHPRHTQRRLTDRLQNNQRLFQLLHMHPKHNGYKLPTGVSSNNLRQLRVHKWFINILYICTSDYMYYEKTYAIEPIMELEQLSICMCPYDHLHFVS